LRLHSGHGSQHCDGRDFATLPIEIVAFEDVAKQVSLKVFVNRWREVEQWPLDRATRQLGLVGGACGK
jgi:hypothetical protein